MAKTSKKNLKEDKGRFGSAAQRIVEHRKYHMPVELYEIYVYNQMIVNHANILSRICQAPRVRDAI